MNLLRPLAAAAFLAGSAVYLAAEAIAASAWKQPPYSYADNWISDLGSATSGVTSFPLVVTVTGTPAGLFSGATATVSIVYRQLTDVLRVPTAAVRYDGGRPYVLLAGAGSGTRREVGVGTSTGGFTQITSGLTEGAQVLVPVTRATTTRSGGQNGSGTGGRGTGGGFGGGGFGGGGGGFGGGGGGGGTRNGGAGAGGAGNGG